MKLGTCRDCNGSLRWVITRKGKRMPLDPDPTDYGNVVIERADAQGNEHVRVLGRDEETTEPRYVSHVVTCPERPQRDGNS